MRWLRAPPGRGRAPRACDRASGRAARRSIARCFAVAMSHAPGLSGTPDAGHCSSAATSASCARSSAQADVAHDSRQAGDELSAIRCARPRRSPGEYRKPRITRIPRILLSDPCIPCDPWLPGHAIRLRELVALLLLPFDLGLEARFFSRNSGVNSGPKSSASKSGRISIPIRSAPHRVRAALRPTRSPRPSTAPARASSRQPAPSSRRTGRR